MIKINPKLTIKNLFDIEDFVHLRNPPSKEVVSLLNINYCKKPFGISVVLPVKGKPFVNPLKNSLERILNLGKNIPNFEVIISEQYESERLYSYFMNVSEKVHYISEGIKNLPEKIFTPGRIRNTGANISNYSILYFTDADILFETDNHLEKILLLMESQDFACCRFKFKNQPKKIPFEKYSFKSDEQNYFFKYVPPMKAHGGSIVVPRKVFDSVAGYSEQFIGWGLEDSDLRWKLNAIVPLIDFSKCNDFEVSHIDHDRSEYLDRIYWERNLFLENLRRRVPVESIILSDLQIGTSAYIKYLRGE